MEIVISLILAVCAMAVFVPAAFMVWLSVIDELKGRRK